MLFAQVLLGFSLVAPSDAPTAQAVHVVIDSERAYMARVQKAQFEYWLASDRIRVSQGGRVTITRRDLGLRWRLDPAKKTYLEEPLASQAPEPPPAADDIHSARFDYEPEFEWATAPAGRIVVAGRECRRYSATGQADYSQTAIAFTIGPRVAVKTVPDVNQILAGLTGQASTMRFLQEAVRARGNGCLMSSEETLEPAIAPTVVQRARITTLEIDAPPPGIFDVPAGYTKAPR